MAKLKLYEERKLQTLVYSVVRLHGTAHVASRKKKLLKRERKKKLKPIIKVYNYAIAIYSGIANNLL